MSLWRLRCRQYDDYHPYRNQMVRLLLHILVCNKGLFFLRFCPYYQHRSSEKGTVSMKAYYNETAENLRKMLNGSLDPLTDAEVKERQKKF